MIYHNSLRRFRRLRATWLRPREGSKRQFFRRPFSPQQLSEARERTWVVQRAVVRHPAQHGHVGGHSAHKAAQSPPWSAKTAVHGHTRQVRCTQQDFGQTIVRVPRTRAVQRAPCSGRGVHMYVPTPSVRQPQNRPAA